jgi:hypothetical protein
MHAGTEFAAMIPGRKAGSEPRSFASFVPRALFPFSVRFVPLVPAWFRCWI